MRQQLQQSDRLDPRVWKITSVAVIGSFLSQLDATVVNVSLSTLAVELHSIRRSGFPDCGAGTCPRCRLFGQVESPPLEISER
jgi:hypothetical protein